MQADADQEQQHGAHNGYRDDDQTTPPYVGPVTELGGYRVADDDDDDPFWFSVSQGEQRTRFAIRQVDPVRQWKLSPMDLRSLDKWDEYTEAKEAMFFYTDTADAPWTVVKSNDKKRARLQAIRHVLSRFDYADKDAEVVGTPDPQIVGPASLAVEGTEMSPRVFPRL